MRLRFIVILVLFSLFLRLNVVYSASTYDPNLICVDPSIVFNPNYIYNWTFAEAWLYIRSDWDRSPECSKGPIKHILNSAGTAYKFWYCMSYGQRCEYLGIGPESVTADIGNCNNGQIRNYTGQQFTGNLNIISGVSSDANASCIPYASQQCEAVMVQVQCCPEGSVAWYVDMNNNSMFYVVTGVADCVPFPEQWLDGLNYSTPVSTPTPTPVSTPTPTPTSTLTPMPTSPDVTPTPSPTSTPLTYPGYTPAPTVVYSTPVYSESVVPTPDNDGTVKDSNIDDIEYNSQVPDVGQGLVEDDTWLDTVFNLFLNHPLVDVIKGSKITTSGELCSLSVNLYGSVVEISFCDLVNYVEIFGYFVTVCASIYAYFIIFRVS